MRNIFVGNHIYDAGCALNSRHSDYKFWWAIGRHFNGRPPASGNKMENSASPITIGFGVNFNLRYQIHVNVKTIFYTIQGPYLFCLKNVETNNMYKVFIGHVRNEWNQQLPPFPVHP